MRLIETFYKTWQSGKLGSMCNQDVIHGLELIHANAGILRSDKPIMNLMSTCFMFGVFMTGYKTDNEPITMNEQEQALRCLNCDKLRGLKCSLDKCKFDK